MKSILSKDFKYTPSQLTDLEKTFARIRREQKADLAEKLANEREAQLKVSDLTNKRRQHGT